jgi:lipoprotein-releasing system ATP-binding protein
MLELNASLNTSLVMVTHDRTLAQRMDQIWSLADGRLAPTEFDELV